jgi:hypothetical protein
MVYKYIILCTWKNWTVLKRKVTHFCIQQSYVMISGCIILCLRPKWPIENGHTKIFLHPEKVKTTPSAGKEWPAIFGILKHFILPFSYRTTNYQCFLKTDISTLHSLSYWESVIKIALLKASLFLKTTKSISQNVSFLHKKECPHTLPSDSRNTGANALRGIATPRLLVLTWPQAIFTWSVHSKRP